MADSVKSIDITPYVIGILVLGVVGFFYFLFSLGASATSTGTEATQDGATNVVSQVDGKQLIEVTVQGGYSPRVISAKAGIPTTLRMESNNAYGCEQSFRIARLGISKILPSSGNTDIDIGTQSAGTRLVGSCSMGMYTVTINFN